MDTSTRSLRASAIPTQADSMIDQNLDCEKKNSLVHNSDSESGPSSQSSISDQSIVSQASHLPSASQDTSQSSIEHALRTQEPPSSLQASQASHGVSRAPVSGQHQGLESIPSEHKGRPQEVLPALDTRSLHEGTYMLESVHGQKRSASGVVKSPNSSVAISPVTASQKGHSRNVSATSRGTQIGDVGQPTLADSQRC